MITHSAWFVVAALAFMFAMVADSARQYFIAIAAVVLIIGVPMVISWLAHGQQINDVLAVAFVFYVLAKVTAD